MVVDLRLCRSSFLGSDEHKEQTRPTSEELRHRNQQLALDGRPPDCGGLSPDQKCIEPEDPKPPNHDNRAEHVYSCLRGVPLERRMAARGVGWGQREVASMLR
jgi:hypothetical protein